MSLLVACANPRAPTDSCVGFSKIIPTEELVVGNDDYIDLFQAGVSLWDYPGDVLTSSTAVQILNHNDFINANCG